MYPEMAAAGLWTTPSDLARLVLELQLSLEGKSNKILSAEMVKQMLTPQVDNQMGLGLFLEGEGEASRFLHEGDTEGFNNVLVAYKHQGMGAVVMINSNEGVYLIEEILPAIADEYGWPNYFSHEKVSIEVDSHVLDAYIGEYELKPGFRFRVTRNDSVLALHPTGQAAIELFPESETSYFMKVVGGKITFVRNEAGEVMSLMLEQDGREIEAKRLGE